jgi:hypothetical protein
MPLPGFIGKLLSGGVGDIVDKVASAADKFIRTKEEKDAFELELLKTKADIELKTATLEKDINEMYLKDTSNARDNNAKIQETANASWMAKNIAYILDIVFTTAFIAMLFVIIYKQVPETNKELFYTSFGLLGGYVSQILGFHRGTSKGSEEKSKELKELNKTKQ